ncbi:NAD-dependent deacylase [Nocardioides daphniae]|uniref:NAD-dependent protein deacylase n=1 Tax=Nocardioides daphniae TaxID=402297 RepID=A0A4P7UET4_9ACTN|nr:NAD-dependent deacylase [Nocardioides daphniae]QCC78444.1 NAD-dependent deacylase [Nocardioides daphniae]GGD12383.1 NAD-dependent protein deacylase [Nocardioides daphniae]
MKVVVLTGAGISAESGVPTFRDSDGLWEGHDVMEVATPEGFAADPALVQRFYDLRRAHLAKVDTNPAHLALARLEQALGDDLLVITQNVDDLHERAGSTRVLHMHGELRSALCLACADRFPWEGDLAHSPACPGCDEAMLRPDVVWFGEMPYRMDEALQALQEADLFVAVGTSAHVQPAAAFVHWAAEQGARTLEINLAETLSTDDFDESRQGRAGDLVPRWVEELLAGR